MIKGQRNMKCLTPYTARASNRGSLLIETAIALMLFVVIGGGLLLGLSRVQSSGRSTASESEAENLIRNQMEYLFSLPYLAPPSSYALVATPPGYGINADALEYVLGDTNIEKVVVQVTFGGSEVMTVETLRTRG